MGSRVFGDHVGVYRDFGFGGVAHITTNLNVGGGLEGGGRVRELQCVAGGIRHIGDTLESVRRPNCDTTHGDTLGVDVS